MSNIDRLITHQASLGHISIQLPWCDINDFPTGWAVTLRGSGSRLSLGKEGGFVFLTRVGWKANKSKIKAAFERSEKKERTWDQFESMIEESLNYTYKSTKKYLENLESDIEEAKTKMKYFE